MGTRHKATERHLLYGITQYYQMICLWLVLLA